MRVEILPYFGEYKEYPHTVRLIKNENTIIWQDDFSDDATIKSILKTIKNNLEEN